MIKVVLLISVVSINSFASSLVGPISHAMGNTGRASVLATESIFLNPAFVSLAQGYHLGLGYYNTELDNDTAKVVNLAVTDATVGTMFPAAIAVTQSKDQDVDKTMYSVASGAAYDKWSWGFTYRYSSYNQRKIRQKTSANQFDVGVLLSPSKVFNIGIVGADLAGSTKTPEIAKLPRRLSAGFTFSFRDQFRLQSDITKFDGPSKNSLEYGLGIDTSLQKYFSFRLGWSKNEREGSILGTTGLAFLGPRLALNYAFSRDFKDEKRISHRVDFSLPF